MLAPKMLPKIIRALTMFADREFKTYAARAASRAATYILQPKFAAIRAGTAGALTIGTVWAVTAALHEESDSADLEDLDRTLREKGFNPEDPVTSDREVAFNDAMRTWALKNGHMDQYIAYSQLYAEKSTQLAEEGATCTPLSSQIAFARAVSVLRRDLGLREDAIARITSAIEQILSIPSEERSSRFEIYSQTRQG